MSKTIEYNQRTFSGAISDDPREAGENKFQITKHFDVFSQPNNMIPYRSMEIDTYYGDTPVSSGVTNPETMANDAATGTEAWVNPDNAKAAGGGYTTVLASGDNRFDISYITYSRSIPARDGSPEGIAWNNDGTKLYEVGSSLDKIYESDVSTAFDVSTATFSQSINTQGTFPTGLAWNNDGSKMYEIGWNPDKIYEYNVSTAFDISTASLSQSISTQADNPMGLAWNNDGSKMYELDSSTDKIYEYDVSTAFDIATASLSQSISAQNSFTTNITWNNDGTKLYEVGSSLDKIYESDVSTAFDISTASFSKSIATRGGSTYGIAWNNDGSKMYEVSASDGKVYEFDIFTAATTENAVKLIKSGVFQGANKSTAATIPSTDTYVTYGSATDTWGLNLTATDINSSTFGVAFSVKGSVTSQYLTATNFSFNVPSGSLILGVKAEIEQKSDGNTVSIDHIRVTVTHAPDIKEFLIKDFLYASGSSKLYGLGQNATGKTKVVQKDDAAGANWTLPDDSEGNGDVQNGCLVEYKDYLWGFQGTTQVFKWGLLSGTPTITNSAGTVSTITSVAQGVIAKDDNLYLPYNNKLARVNAGGTVQNDVLILPTNFKITSVDNYGEYLAIGCSPSSSFNGESKVFLWNLISDDVQMVIDWGEGDLRVLSVIEGMIVGVTDRYLNNATGAGKGSMVVQVYQGGNPQVVKEVFTEALTGKEIPIQKFIKNNRIFFACKIMTNLAGTTWNEGIWSFGRKSVMYPFALSLDVVDENVDANGIQSFGSAANYFFISHSGDGSIDKTDDTDTYSFTSVFESQILDFGDVFSDKTLHSVKVSHPRLLTGQSLAVLYRIDGETDWRMIGEHTAVGTVSHTFVNIESTSLPFASGKEFEIRLESKGGLGITGLAVKARINDNV